MRHAAEAHLDTGAERAGVVGVRNADTAGRHAAGDQCSAQRLGAAISLRVALLRFDHGGVERAHRGAVDGVADFAARFGAKARATEGC